MGRIITFLPDADYQQVVELSKASSRSLSQTVAILVAVALEDRGRAEDRLGIVTAEG